MGTGLRARQRIRALKAATFVLCLVPLALLGAKAFQGRLGADPIARALNDLGYWSLVMLLASLACTPLKLLGGWTWPLQVRRMVGLFAFFYGTLHLTMYVGIDQGFDLSEIWADIVKHKFITIGLLAWLLLLPLALTSTSGWVRRLGFSRWKSLHRLAYVAGAAGCVHFLMRGKVVTRESLVFLSMLIVLLGVRGLALFRPGKAAVGAR